MVFRFVFDTSCSSGWDVFLKNKNMVTRYFIMWDKIAQCEVVSEYINDNGEKMMLVKINDNGTMGAPTPVVANFTFNSVTGLLRSIVGNSYLPHETLTRRDKDLLTELHRDEVYCFEKGVHKSIHSKNQQPIKESEDRFSNKNINTLNSRLKIAIRDEDYIEAAKIRDRIKELKGE